jgi:tetratricopeptide (TPR) repeat protein
VRHFFRKSKTWQGHFDEGMKYGAASDLSRAEASFREAVQLAPEEPYPHYQLGYTLSLVGRHEEALEEFRRTEELWRGFFIVETEIYLCEQILSGSIDLAVLGMLRSLQWLVDAGEEGGLEALALSRNVVEAAPECALGHFHLGKAMLQREPQAAEEALSRCLELHPDDSTAINAKFHLGILRQQAGQEDDAHRIWREIASDYRGHPHTALANMSLGRDPGG